MALSITTDYCEGTGDPSPYLRHIAEAGFTHIHWCHHWHTDFIYTEPEIAQIQSWLSEFGLQLLDLHATTGQEKNWTSEHEYERQAGVELVQNRIDMVSRLGGDVTIIHLPIEPGHDQFRRSMDELRDFAMQRNMRIALENGKLEAMVWAMAEFEPEYVGLCYDSGHGNIGWMDLDSLETYKDRLLSVHLHDNDGKDDLHQLPFTGTIDWDRLTRIIAASSYDKPISMEVVRSDGDDEIEFLTEAFKLGQRLTAMVEAAS